MFVEHYLRFWVLAVSCTISTKGKVRTKGCVCVLKISKEQRGGGNTYTVIQASREHERLFFWLERQFWACEQGIAWCSLVIPRSTKWDFLWSLFKKIKKPATLEVSYSITLFVFFSTGMQKNLDSVYTLNTMDNSIFSVSGV